MSILDCERPVPLYETRDFSVAKFNIDAHPYVKASVTTPNSVRHLAIVANRPGLGRPGCRGTINANGDQHPFRLIGGDESQVANLRLAFDDATGNLSVGAETGVITIDAVVSPMPEKDPQDLPMSLRPPIDGEFSWLHTPPTPEEQMTRRQRYKMTNDMTRLAIAAATSKDI